MFIDRSDLLAFNPPMLAYGVCVFDADGDGQDEFYIAGFGFPGRILAWDGEQFVDRHFAALSTPERQSIGVAAGDMDGDGREELYILNTDTFSGTKRFGDNLFAWRDGAWVDLFTDDENLHLINRTSGRSVCVLDRFGRGRYGFVIANYGGPARLYEQALDGDDFLTDSAHEAGMDLVAGGRALVALPLVSSPGRMDVYAANENGPNFLFVNDGSGGFTEEAGERGVADPFEHARGVAVLDADAQGRFDIAIGNWQGEHRLYLQSPMGGFLDAAPPEMARPCAVRTLIAADFDNDGFEELFFNNMGEPNRLFGYRDGQWVRIPIGDALEADGLGTGAAVADLDGDGVLELLVAHGEATVQPLSLYKPEPNDNNWLRIKPLTAAGAPARGAVVTLMTAERVLRRVIDAGSGYLCQMEPVAHFGLGTGKIVERVEIVWPGGASVTLEHPDLRQTIVVSYPK